MRELVERIETLAHPENITESRMGKKAHDGYAEAKNLLVSVLRSAPTLFKKHKNVEAASVSGNAVTVQLVSHEPVVITYQLKAYARAKSGAALHMKSGASKVAFDFPSQAVASWTLPDMVASLFTDFAKKHAVRIPLPKNVTPRPKLRAPKPAPKPAAPALTPGEVTSFLKRLTTRTGGRNRDVYFNDDPKWPSWSAEPQRRQRLDHFGNDGDGWDEDGWDDKYAGPLQREVQRAIDQKFGKGVLGVAVGEKGHIDVQPTAKGKRLIERLEENAMKELIERIEEARGGFLMEAKAGFDAQRKLADLKAKLHRQKRIAVEGIVKKMESSLEKAGFEVTGRTWDSEPRNGMADIDFEFRIPDSSSMSLGEAEINDLIQDMFGLYPSLKRSPGGGWHVRFEER